MKIRGHDRSHRSKSVTARTVDCTEETGQTTFYLTPLHADHLSTVAGWILDLDDLSLFDSSIRVPISADALRHTWLGPNEGVSQDRYWFSLIAEDGALVAVVALEKVSFVNRDAVVPMFVNRSFRGRGVGVRCLSLVMDIAFLQLGLHRLTTYLRADNGPSRSMTERVGFQREGCMRQAWFSGGQHHDMLILGILRHEWIERRKAIAEKLDPRTVVIFGREMSGKWSWPPVRNGNGAQDAIARDREVGRPARVKAPRP